MDPMSEVNWEELFAWIGEESRTHEQNAEVLAMVRAMLECGAADHEAVLAVASILLATWMAARVSGKV